MTSDGDALFRVICERPWEDTPRLIYADWLQENGDPLRAEFIRLQCRFPDRPPNAQLPKRAGVDEKRFEPVLRRCAEELPELRGVEWFRHHFERGFVCWVTFDSPNKFREHAATVFAAAPVDFVSVYSVHERTARHVLRSPLLARLKKLALTGSLTAKVIREVAGCPHLTRVEDMWLRDGVTDEGAAALAASPYLGRLTDLTIMWHALTPEGVRALIRSGGLAAVKDLALTPHDFDADLAAELRKRFRRCAWRYPPPSGKASKGSS